MCVSFTTAILNTLLVCSSGTIRSCLRIVSVCLHVKIPQYLNYVSFWFEFVEADVWCCVDHVVLANVMAEFCCSYVVMPCASFLLSCSMYSMCGQLSLYSLCSSCTLNHLPLWSISDLWHLVSSA